MKGSRIFKTIMNIAEWASAIILGGMVLLIFLQVLFRYVFDAPLAWTEELARFAFIWGTFIASFVAAVKGQHVAVTMLEDRLQKPWRNLLTCFTNLLGAGFFLLVAYYCITQWQKLATQTSPALKVPMSIVYLGMIIGTVGMGIWYAYLAVKSIVDIRKDEEVEK